jgi:hypothetical protein
MSILSDHQDAAIRKNRKHHDRTRMRNDLASGRHPSRFQHGVASNAEDAPFEHNLAAHNSSHRFFLGHAISCRKKSTAILQRKPARVPMEFVALAHAVKV